MSDQDFHQERPRLSSFPEVDKTDWFSAWVSHPEVEGWYEVREVISIHPSSKYHLTGHKTRWYAGNGVWLTEHPSDRFSKESVFGKHRNHQWRGLRFKMEIHP